MSKKNNEYTDWQQEELAASLDKFPERKKRFTNHGGEEIERLERQPSPEAEKHQIPLLPDEND